MRVRSQTHCLRLDLVEQAKLNLESDYLIVQFISEYSRAKSILYIVSGQRVGHRVMYQRK